MRHLFLLIALCLFASTVRAQGVEPSPSERTVIVLGGTLGAASAAAGTYALLEEDAGKPAGVAFIVLSYAGGLALGTSLAGEALGLTAPLDAALVDAALGLPAGALAGVAVGGIVAGLIYLPTRDVEYNFLPALIGGGVGMLTAVGVSGVVASRRVEAAPVALRAPTGEQAAGLTLRIGL